MDLIRGFNNTLATSLEDMYIRLNQAKFGYVDKIFEDIQTKIQELNQQVKNNSDNYTVDINYDRDTEKLSYAVNDRQLIIKVETLDECRVEETESSTSSNYTSNELKVTLPQNVDSANVSQKYDSEQKIMTFIFPKTTD